MEMIASRQAVPVKKRYYGVTEVMQMLGCQRSKASNVINKLNRELAEKGYEPFGRGKVNKEYFNKRFGINEEF